MAAVDRSPSPPRPRTVLLDDEALLIEHEGSPAQASTLVITFDPLLHRAPQPPFGQAFLRQQALAIVSVRKKAEHFYQPLSRQAFEAVVLPVARHYRRVVCYGSSLGAYAALYFARDQPWGVIALSPRNSTHPVHGTPHWQQRVAFVHERFDPAVPARCEAVIVYDPRDRIDRRYVEAELLPQFPAAEVLRVPYSGHPSTHVLNDMGFLSAFVRALLAGRPRLQWPPLQRRVQRRRSAAYLQHLAQRCVEQRHVAWADALVARALALAPERPLVLRTLGQVRLAQRRWDEAAAALQQALAALPDDRLAQSLSRRAMHQGVDPLSDPPPAARWRRVLRRLARLCSGRGRAAAGPDRHTP